MKNQMWHHWYSQQARGESIQTEIQLHQPISGRRFKIWIFPTHPGFHEHATQNLRFRKMIFWVVVSNIFYFHPYLGKIPILANIFQMGWNHQPVFLFNWLTFCFELLILQGCNIHSHPFPPKVRADCKYLLHDVSAFDLWPCRWKPWKNLGI